MTWGVETMTCEFCQISDRFSGGMLPVNVATVQPGSACLKKSECCSTSGFVGARIRAFPPRSPNRAAITISATTVFPSPVGSTHRHDSFSADEASASWYNRCSITSFLISGWEMYRFITVTYAGFRFIMLCHYASTPHRFSSMGRRDSQRNGLPQYTPCSPRRSTPR